MKKTILFIPLLFIAVSVIVSCQKTCTCNFVMNNGKIVKDVEMEKYKRNCKDQSQDYDPITYVDSLDKEHLLLDTLSHFVCE